MRLHQNQSAGEQNEEVMILYPLDHRHRLLILDINTIEKNRHVITMERENGEGRTLLLLQEAMRAVVLTDGGGQRKTRNAKRGARAKSTKKAMIRKNPPKKKVIEEQNQSNLMDLLPHLTGRMHLM